MAAKLGFIQGEAVPGTKISQVEQKIFQRIIWILERRADGKTLSVIEKTEENAAPRRDASFVDQSELSPCVSRGHAPLDPFALGSKFATPADFRIIPLGLRIGQPKSEFV